MARGARHSTRQCRPIHARSSITRPPDLGDRWCSRRDGTTARTSTPTSDSVHAAPGLIKWLQANRDLAQQYLHNCADCRASPLPRDCPGSQTSASTILLPTYPRYPVAENRENMPASGNISRAPDAMPSEPAQGIRFAPRRLSRGPVEGVGGSCAARLRSESRPLRAVEIGSRLRGPRASRSIGPGPQGANGFGASAKRRSSCRLRRVAHRSSVAAQSDPGRAARREM